MNLPNLSGGLKTFKNVVTANSPVLLVGAAIAGVVTTGVLAAKGGYKARGIIDEAVEEKGEELTTQEKVQLTWLCYAAPALTGASTIAATIGVHTIHTKRFTALSSLYAVAINKADDYQEKAEELLGAKKQQDLQDQRAAKAIARGTVPGDNEIIILDGGTEICYDETSGRWFRGSMNIIEAAINETNKKLLEEGSASLNDFYEAVGLSEIPLGYDLGWSGTKIEARYGNGELTPDSRPVIAFWFSKEPKPKMGLA